MTGPQGRVPTGWVKEVVLDDAAFRHQHRIHARNQDQAKARQLEAAAQAQSRTTTPAVSAAAAAAIAAGRVTGQKRKREPVGDPTVLFGKNAYKGPWARYTHDSGGAAPATHEDEIVEVTVEDGETGSDGTDVEVVYVYEDEDEAGPASSSEEDRPKRKGIAAAPEEPAPKERTEFYGDNMYDYQGRTYMHVPTDLNINLRADLSGLENFVPKKVVHTWKSHKQSITQLRFFPNSGHLLLSASADSTVKIYDVYHQRSLLRSYLGHTKSVNDICFNNDGSRFLTSSYDRQMKLWDTETGACLGRYSTGKTAHVVRFNPDPALNHEFVAGMSDKKIVQFDTRTSEQVQEYDHHLGPVNTITFCDENRRFITTSDDKSLRAWEYGIPVPIKFIAEPHMYSMVRSAAHPNGKFVAFQSLDDQIVVYASTDKFRQNRKKVFQGHHNAGYAVGLSFSPDGSILSSGDADGQVFFWDWKTGKSKQTLPVSDSAVISVQWHPRETSKLATGDVKGVIKYWD